MIYYYYIVRIKKVTTTADYTKVDALAVIPQRRLYIIQKIPSSVLRMGLQTRYFVSQSGARHRHES